MNFLKKFNVALLLLVFCGSLFIAPLQLWAQEEEAVAVVNGVAITKAEFHELLEQEFGTYVLQELIQRELIKQKAEATGAGLDEEEFAQLYEIIIAQLGGPEALQMFLMQNNATEEQFKDQIQMNMLVSELASSEVEVTDEILQAWFAENRHYYDEPETVEVSHILVETEEEAKEIIELLNDGQEFAELAAERSTDQGTAIRGGYLGHIPRGQTVQEFEDMSFSLAVDELGVTESGFGWHVILIHAKNEGSIAEYSDVEDFVSQDYKSEKALDAQSYLIKLQQEADLEILWPAK